MVAVGVAPGSDSYYGTSLHLSGATGDVTLVLCTWTKTKLGTCPDDNGATTETPLVHLSLCPS